MSKNKKQPPVQQTSTGDGNIQITGDNNTVRQEVTKFIPVETSQKDGEQNESLNSSSTAASSVNQAIIGNENIQVAGNNNFIQRVINLFKLDTEQQRALKKRRAMLELVKNTWIKGVLEKSLYKEILIELGMEERKSAVDRPWDMLLQKPNELNRPLPIGTSMIDVFDEMNGTILILGAPGSGKTTMLLELARDCISRAEEDNTQPIPIIFNLSSWSDPKQSIDDWLVNELITKYNVPKKVGLSWVINDELQLLLDGLDEIKPENRAACVKAINDCRQKHGLTTPIAVCSRIADYEVLTTKLNLASAVVLQPLTSIQVDNYFEEAGPELAGVYQVLKHDAILQELVKQPLMLSILTLAYRGAPSETFTGMNFGTIEIRRKRLFDTYIQQMFERVARTKSQLYTQKQTRLWLSWLADRMVARRQSLFLLDQMDQNWLQTPAQKKQYKVVVQLIGGVVIGLGFGLPAAFGSGDLVGGLLVGLFSGVIFSFFFVEIAITSNIVTRFHILKWSWRRSAIGTALAVLCLGLLGILGSGRELGLLHGFFQGVPTGLLIGLGSGIQGEILKERANPKQAIRQYLKNGIVVWLAVWLVAGLAMELFFGLPSGQKFGAAGGLLGGWILGFFAALYVGGIAVTSHYALCLVIYSYRHMPLNYIRFLDYCVDRIFLRRVGGGYIFVHRFLMEHFAAMYHEIKE